MADEPNMQSESQPGVANGTPQQDEPKSYLPEQTAEYPRNNNTVRGINVPLSLSLGRPKSKSRTLDPTTLPQPTRNLNPPQVL